MLYYCSNLKSLYTLLFVSILILGAKAQRTGNSVYGIFSVPTSSVSAAHGGAYISQADNYGMQALDNAALVDSNNYRKLNFSYINYLSDINMGYVGMTMPVKKLGAVNVALQYINYGKFIQTDASGNPNGEFRVGEYALNAAWAKRINEKLKAGINSKLVYSDMYNVNSLGIAADAGLYYENPEKKFGAGLVVKNMGMMLKNYYEQSKYAVPMLVQLGISKKLKYAPFRVNLLVNNLQRPNLVKGRYKYDSNGNIDKEWKIYSIENIARHLVPSVEFTPSETFSVIIGYNHQRRKETQLPNLGGISGFSLGTSFKIKRFQFSYSLASYSMAGFSNIFSLTSRI